MGSSWRQQQPGDASSPLSHRQQQQVAATCQALFAAALRRPGQLPRSVRIADNDVNAYLAPVRRANNTHYHLLLDSQTAAGLLVVLRRLQLHSPPTCALLVERLLAGPGVAEVAGGVAADPGSTAKLEANRKGGKRLRLALRHGHGWGRGVTPLRLEWVAMALSCLAQLRVPAEALPRRTVTRLFRWVHDARGSLQACLPNCTCHTE